MNDSAREICSTIWNAIVYTDTTPELDFIEVYFGVGPLWNGDTNTAFMYQFSSIRNDSLILLSQNLCKQNCTEFFPKCFHFGEEDICGQSYERSLDGVKAALQDVETIHKNSPTNSLPVWAVLVIFDAQAKEKILYTWQDIEDPQVKCDAPEKGKGRTGSAWDQWWEVNKTWVFVLFGLLVIVFSIFLVSFLTRRKGKKWEVEDKLKEQEERAKAEKCCGPGGKEGGESDGEKRLEKEVEKDEKKAEEASYFVLPGTVAPTTI